VVTRKSKCSASKFSLASNFLSRGGIAVVWLGMKDNQLYAMKQFPVKERRQVD
jgi:hypothetical protein